MVHETRPLWTCPKCGAKLVARNMSHSCGLATLAGWRARMGPRARDFCDRFEQMIAICGEYHVAPALSRISFMARVRFANITSVSEKGMSCNFALPYRVRDRRLARVDEVVPGWWVHHLRIASVEEFDAQLQDWLCRSYHLMGMQQRLAETKSPRPASTPASRVRRRPVR